MVHAQKAYDKIAKTYDASFMSRTAKAEDAIIYGALDWAQKSLGMDDVEIQRLIEDVKAPDALAAEEYGQPWTPAFGSVPKEADISATIEAADKLRAMELKIRQAKTEEDRDAARKDVQVYRVNLVFSNEEAEVVRKILGKRPAQKIYQWCLKENDGN